MQVKRKTEYLWFVAGFLFAALWASASTATKIGLSFSQPLVIAEFRFCIAAFIMLCFAHMVQAQRFPSGKEWKQLAIYGFLNITVYLGCYVIAMQAVTAGIGALAVASNPVFIGFLSAFFLKKKLTAATLVSIVICTAGVLCAAWPLFEDASVNGKGLLLLLGSMLSYSVGAIYFSSQKWNDLSLITINGWQTLLGGLFLLPFALLSYKSSANHFTQSFWTAVLWLAIPVSIFAVQLWLWLLRGNAMKAGLWLFLCPLFGYLFAAWLMKDSISIYTVVGVLLVIGGLLLSKVNTQKNEVVFD